MSGNDERVLDIKIQCPCGGMDDPNNSFWILWEVPDCKRSFGWFLFDDYPFGYVSNGKNVYIKGATDVVSTLSKRIKAIECCYCRNFYDKGDLFTRVVSLYEWKLKTEGYTQEDY